VSELHDIPSLVQAACYAAEQKEGSRWDLQGRSASKWAKIQQEKQAEIQRIIDAHYAYEAEKAATEKPIFDAVEEAATQLLESTTPTVSALEVEHGMDGVELYNDLANTLGYGTDES
jgi:hypothetical protein